VVSTGSASPQAPHAGAAQAAGATSGSGQCTGIDPALIVAHSGPHAPQNQRQWLQIPETMRQLRQWCFSPPSTKAPYDAKTGKPASVTNWITWSSFDEACAAARYTGGRIGFVLHASDPFCIIDLDVKDTTPPEHLERYQRIVEAFDSYTELSVSGRGLHVICFGSLPANKGARRDGVEVYNDARYMLTTGRSLRGTVQPRQDLLNTLYADIQAGRNQANHTAWQMPASEPDDKVIDRGWHAANGSKFQRLWLGDWQGLGYPSQSEADHALLSMLAFYTYDNAQAMRLFRRSALGKRPKAQNDAYLMRSIVGQRHIQETIFNMAESLTIPPAP
jgi:primase-polymerase (primpol)-like protein